MAKYSVDILLQVVDTGARAVLNSFGAAVKENFKDFYKPKLGFEGIAKVGLMTSAAINAVDIATDVLSGDIQKAAEAAKKLPFGVGQMATTLENILGKWTGIQAEIDASNSDLRLQQALNDSNLKSVEQQLSFRKQMKALADSARGSALTAGAHGEDKQYMPLDVEADAQARDTKRRLEDRTKEIKDQLTVDLKNIADWKSERLKSASELTGGAWVISKLTFGFGEPEDDAQIARRNDTEKTAKNKIDALKRSAEKDIEDAKRLAAQVNSENLKSTAAKRTEVDEQIMEARAQAAEESRNYVEDMQKQENAALSELKAKQLEDTNQMLDAEKERIRQSYEDKIKSAEYANEKITADALRAQMALDIKKAERTDLERRSPAIDKLIKESEQTYLDRKKLMTVDPMQTAASIISSSLSRVPGSGSAKSESLLTGIKEVLGDTKRLTERMTRSIERGFLVPAGF